MRRTPLFAFRSLTPGLRRLSGYRHEAEAAWLRWQAATGERQDARNASAA